MSAPSYPLSEQIAEVEREIRHRCRVYPKWVADGRYKQETADEKLAKLRAAQSTLVWLEANADWIREAAKARAHRQQREREIEELSQDPAVTAVLDAFPGSQVADVREIERVD